MRTMQGLTELTLIGATVYTTTFVLFTWGTIRDQRTGQIESFPVKLGGLLLVFGHVLVPIPAIAAVGHFINYMGISGDGVGGFGLLAIPLGFCGAILCLALATYTAEYAFKLTDWEKKGSWADSA